MSTPRTIRPAPASPLLPNDPNADQTGHLAARIGHLSGWAD
jgi:hypothetical protein